MTKVTDKYHDPIELAKSKAILDYSIKKVSAVPTEIVDLPSKGRFYPANHPLRSGKIEMRYMTAYDEDILTNMSYIRNGVVIDKLLQELIVTPNIQFDDILNCDRDALIIGARILSYGKIYNVEIASPNDTNKILKRSVDLSKLDLKTSLLEADSDGICEYNSDNYKIKFKYLTIKQQAQVTTSAMPLYEFLVHSIVSINGETNQERIKEYLRYNMLAVDSKALRKYIIDNMPTMNIECEFEDENGGVFTSSFQVGPDFFYPKS